MPPRAHLDTVMDMNAALGLLVRGGSAERSHPQSGRPTAKPDARRYPRRPYAGRVRCAELGNCELAALNISPGGIGLLSTRQLVQGQRVTLQFTGGAVSVEGIVRRVRTIFSCDWLVGVEFVQDQPQLLAAIGCSN